jgi:RND family efflux transporter MFP subunit
MIRLHHLVLLAGVWAAVPGCREKDAAPAGGVRPAATPVMKVQVQTVQPQRMPLRIAIVGTLFAAEEATISTKASGILQRTFVDAGSVVRPGDPLAQVQPRDYEVAVRQAEAALAEALARLGLREAPDDDFDPKQISSVKRATAQLENARYRYERLTELREGFSSGQELNDAATQLRMAEADHQLATDEAVALVATARERQSLLQMAQQRLDDAQTRTPAIPTTRGEQGADTWVIAARLVTEGQYLNVGDPLYELLITDPLKLRSRVPERYAGHVQVGQRVELELDSAHRPTGRISRVSPGVDPTTRTFEIEALIDNESGAVKPGIFAKGTIVADSETPTVFVPSGAVVSSGGATRLFVVENGVARHRDVQTGRQAEGLVEVVSGVRAGEKVVTRGAPVLTDGMAVEVGS